MTLRSHLIRFISHETLQHLRQLMKEVTDTHEMLKHNMFTSHIILATPIRFFVELFQHFQIP